MSSNSSAPGRRGRPRRFTYAGWYAAWLQSWTLRGAHEQDLRIARVRLALRIRHGAGPVGIRLDDSSWRGKGNESGEGRCRDTQDGQEFVRLELLEVSRSAGQGRRERLRPPKPGRRP